MAKVCRDHGVEISLESPVEKVLVDGGKAVGVKLVGGEEIAAARVIANVGPKLLYERMIDAADLPQDFQRRIRGFKAGSGTFRSEEHTSELQSLMRLSYAVFCLKKKKKQTLHQKHNVQRFTTTQKT